jgi:HSP20 family protein
MAESVYIPVNVSSDDDTFVISAYVPGIKADDLQIEVLEDSISIEGEFIAEEDESMRLLRQEQPTGRFQRTLRLRSQLDAGGVVAEVKDGILTLRVPKAEQAKTRKIAVKAK